jgi:uncharacterized SAM-binding protein YcdF (DUF218 family)
MTRRLIAVLGYSNGGSTLHDVCTARLRRAEAEAREGDLVLLSGWSRRRGGRSEAELMAEAWRGPEVELIVAGDARTTYGNAIATRQSALTWDADEVVLVTSLWHARRALALVGAALRGSGIAVSLAPVEGRTALRTLLRELLCWTFAPAQAAVLAGWGRAPGPG